MIEVTDLMKGDLVLFPHSTLPDRVQEILYVEGKGMCASFAASATLFPVEIEKLKPVPLTREILEKNGFKNYNVGHNVSGWTILDDEYCPTIPITFTDNDIITNPGVYIWGPVEDDREESFVREIGRIQYVHELQHVLKACKIEKEIIV